MKKKVEGCWPVRTLVRACLLLGLLPTVGSAAAVNLRSPRDARAWSVLLQADETLRWRWHAEATAATLTASNLLTGVVATSAPVVRGGDIDGACAIPSTGDEDARLVDVTLVQLAGEAVLETQTARLQIGMRADTVFTTTEAQAFHEIQEPKPFAWSDAWTGREAAAAALVVADETGASVSASDLPAAGGWGVLDPRAAFARRYGAFDVSVVFDGEAALSARLVRPNLGTLLFIR